MPEIGAPCRRQPYLAALGDTGAVLMAPAMTRSTPFKVAPSDRFFCVPGSCSTQWSDPALRSGYAGG